MEQASGPPAQAPAPPAEDAAPATRADLRWLRRWIAVAAVWAIAATAVAIIALVGRRSDTGKTAHLRSDLSRVESDLGGRISSLEAQLRNLPKAQDVSNLQTRLRKV